ncbi:MAG: PqqD family peptide modification chaperone [Syntrophothermus sp.]
MISLDSTVVASSQLVSANLDGEVVILGFQSGSYFGLDQVGAFVWDSLQKPQKVGEIRDRILEEYDIDSTRCEQDLLNLLESLLDKQLIEIKAEAST